MKIISIGDIHGRPYWKEIDPTKYDKIIFEGDYVDSQYYSGAEIIENLREIIQFKLQNYQKVILLIGNHDAQYIWDDPDFRCTGFNAPIAMELHKIFTENYVFQVAYQEGNHIWTHAGISTGWYKHNIEVIKEIETKFNTKDLADTLNHMMMLKENKVLHQVGELRGGYLKYGGITWADKKETMNGYLPGYHQIVGHTSIRSIEKYGDENGSIRYIDVLAQVSILREQIAHEMHVYGSSNRIEEEKFLTKFYEFELNV